MLMSLLIGLIRLIAGSIVAALIALLIEKLRLRKLTRKSGIAIMAVIFLCSVIYVMPFSLEEIKPVPDDYFDYSIVIFGVDEKLAEHTNASLTADCHKQGLQVIRLSGTDGVVTFSLDGSCIGTMGTLHIESTDGIFSDKVKLETHKTPFPVTLQQ